MSGHRSLPPSALSGNPPRPALIAMLRRSSESIDLEGAAVPPLRAREPFAVERMPSPNGFVRLVGYDGRGEYMSEFVVPVWKYNERLPARFEAWLREMDGKRPDQPPTLALA